MKGAKSIQCKRELELRYISQDNIWFNDPRFGDFWLIIFDEWFTIDDFELMTLVMIPNIALLIDDPGFSNFQWLIDDSKFLILEKCYLIDNSELVILNWWLLKDKSK